MRLYVDSSALVKRVVDESESEELLGTLQEHVTVGDPLLSSTVAWIEVGRALRSLLDGLRTADEIADAVDVALSGVAGRALTGDVVAVARRLGPPHLRSLDAIHVATALVLDVEAVVAYDSRLIDACRAHGLRVLAPGR